MRITRRIAASTSKANPRWMGKKLSWQKAGYVQSSYEHEAITFARPQLFDFEGLTVKKQAVIVQTN